VLRLVVVVVVVMACSALVVGCGGGDDSGGREAQTVIEDEDQRLAEEALLTLSDFPSDWTESADDDDEGEDVSEAKCFEDIQPDLSELTVTGHAESGTFETDDAWVSSTASVYRSEEEAREAFEGGADALRNDRIADCFGEVFAEGLAEEENDVEIEVGQVSASEASLPDVGAERSAGLRVEIPLDVEGQAVSAYMEFIGLQEARTIGSLVTFSFVEPFPADETERLAGVMADRLGG
jgi:hypothetical protein